MKYNIKTTEITLTPAISEYVEKKLSHLDKFITADMEGTLMCYVELGKSTNHHKNGDLFMMEINIRTGSTSFNTKAEETDLYASIDVATEEMAEVLKSFKGKKHSLLKKGGLKIKSLLRKFYESDNQ